MIPKVGERKGVAIRLALAALACAGIFLASPDSPSSSDSCGSTSYGDVVVTNPTAWATVVKFSGPETRQTTVEPEGTATIMLQAGVYGWTATTTFSAGVHFGASGGVQVKRGKSVGIVINFD